MQQADQLVQEIRQSLEPITQQLLQHPYIAALEAGQVPREQLDTFAGEQYHIITSDLRSVAQLVARYGATASRDFFLDVLAGEHAAWKALLAFGQALGLSEAELRAHEPLAGAHAYTCYMAWLGLYGSDAEVAAAYLVNFPAWGQSCGRLSRALQARYGLQPDEVAFFDLFASPSPSFEPSALAVIERGLQQGADPRLIRRAARLLQAYELMYWDTLLGALPSSA